MTGEKQQVAGRQFIIESIEKTEPPSGMTKGDWFAYTLTNQSAPISGVRSGTLKSVTSYLEEYVENLNARIGSNPSSSYVKKVSKK